LKLGSWPESALLEISMRIATVKCAISSCMVRVILMKPGIVNVPSKMGYGIVKMQDDMYWVSQQKGTGSHLAGKRLRSKVSAQQD
jgi:hypothetical protein